MTNRLLGLLSRDKPTKVLFVDRHSRTVQERHDVGVAVRAIVTEAYVGREIETQWDEPKTAFKEAVVLCRHLHYSGLNQVIFAHATMLAELEGQIARSGAADAQTRLPELVGLLRRYIEASGLRWGNGYWLDEGEKPYRVSR